jgi:hypothetical protein
MQDEVSQQLLGSAHVPERTQIEEAEDNFLVLFSGHRLYSIN